MTVELNFQTADTVIASQRSRECAPDEAKQSIAPQRSKEWIASQVLPCANALRLSQAMTYETRFRIPAARCARVVDETVHPLQSEGAGNAGRPMRPQPRV
jgi:hypothetical protein